MNRRESLLDEAQRLIEAGRPSSQRKGVLAARIVAAVRSEKKRFPKRKPPEAGIAVPAVPPKGPLPKQGGAAAEFEFDD